MAIRTYRLVSEPAEAGLYCDKNGITLAGIALLKLGVFGFEPRPVLELQSLFDAAYGDDVLNAERTVNGLSAAARALNADDLARATMTSLFLRLPDIDAHAASRLEKADALLKANFNPTQLRDGKGRWAEEGMTQVQGVAIPLPELIPPLELPNIPFPEGNIVPPLIMPRGGVDNGDPGSDDKFPEDCKEERRQARQFCLEKFRDGTLRRRDRFFGRWLDECFRGQVSARCGGNPFI